MNPTTLRTVAATLQSAKEGSRELDAQCARAMGLNYDYEVPEGKWIIDVYGARPGLAIPRWTTSLDASRAFLAEQLPGWWIASSYDPLPDDGDKKGVADIGISGEMKVISEAHTERLACMAAILLALAAKIEGEASAPVCEAVG